MDSYFLFVNRTAIGTSAVDFEFMVGDFKTARGSKLVFEFDHRRERGQISDDAAVAADEVVARAAGHIQNVVALPARRTELADNLMLSQQHQRTPDRGGIAMPDHFQGVENVFERLRQLLFRKSAQHAQTRSGRPDLGRFQLRLRPIKACGGGFILH